MHVSRAISGLPFERCGYLHSSENCVAMVSFTSFPSFMSFSLVPKLRLGMQSLELCSNSPASTHYSPKLSNVGGFGGRINR